VVLTHFTGWFVWFLVFYATFNKISAITWRSSDFPTHLYLVPRVLIIGKISHKSCELGKDGKSNNFFFLFLFQFLIEIYNHFFLR
jgi:hypothetical protein